MKELSLTNIESSSDLRIIKFHSMKDNLNDNSGSNLFVCEGDKVVLKMLKSNLVVNSILANRRFYEKYSEIISENKSATLFTASDDVLINIIGFKMHSGVMALAQKPANVMLEKLSDRIICLNGVVDSENVGSVIRNALAFNFDSILYDKQTSSPFLRRAVRVSMGATFDLKISNTDDLAFSLNQLKYNGYKIISAEITDNAQSVFNFHFSEKFVLIFGNEAQGINSEILSISDYVIKIPISNKIESINVASSSAVILSNVVK